MSVYGFILVRIFPAFFRIRTEYLSPLNILNMSIIANVISITLLPTESLFREMLKAPIYEIKATEMNQLWKIIFALLINDFFLP